MKSIAKISSTTQDLKQEGMIVQKSFFPRKSGMKFRKRKCLNESSEFLQHAAIRSRAAWIQQHLKTSAREQKPGGRSVLQMDENPLKTKRWEAEGQRVTNPWSQSQTVCCWLQINFFVIFVAAMYLLWSKM